VFVLPAQVVFVTRYRHQVFTAAHLERLEQIMRDACADSGTELAEVNGEPGHVHLLVSFPPEVALSRLASSLKGVSSRRLRQEFPALARRRWRGLGRTDVLRMCDAWVGGGKGTGGACRSPDGITTDLHPSLKEQNMVSAHARRPPGRRAGLVTQGAGRRYARAGLAAGDPGAFRVRPLRLRSGPPSIHS
jgi:REP element-mobilizing transposase RayT